MLPYRSVSDSSGLITTYVQLASGVGTLTEGLIVYVLTSSGSAIGIICLLEYLLGALFYRRLQAKLTIMRHMQLTLTFPSGTIGGVMIPFSVPLIDDNIAEHQ